MNVIPTTSADGGWSPRRAGILPARFCARHRWWRWESLGITHATVVVQGCISDPIV